jgi:integrase/recombinase XerD
LLEFWNARPAWKMPRSTREKSAHKLHVNPFSVHDGRAERVNIQALLGHVNLANTQLYTDVGEERMAAVTARGRPVGNQRPAQAKKFHPRPSSWL